MQPPVVLWLRISPEAGPGSETLRRALTAIVTEDETLRVKTVGAADETMIGSTGEAHLEAIVERLYREFGVEARLGKPEIAYKEALTRPSEGEGRYIRQLGDRGQYDHVKIRVFPRQLGEGCEFVNKIVGGVLPEEFIKPIEKGIREAMTTGVLAGYPVDDVRVELYDGSFHDVDSSEIALKIAGSMAFKDAVKRGRPVLLEPIMRVEARVPDGHADELRRALRKRQALIQSEEKRETDHAIVALGTLSRLLGFSNELSERTGGGCGAIVTYDSYRPVRSGLDDGEEESEVGSPRPRPPAPKRDRIALPEPDDDVPRLR